MVQPGGRNSGSITEAMNSTVISGTPRTNSMKPIESQRTIGMFERRPSASRMPIGKAPAMPTLATTSVTSRPPHSSVGTRGKARARRRTAEKARTGKITSM